MFERFTERARQVVVLAQDVGPQTMPRRVLDEGTRIVPLILGWLLFGVALAIGILIGWLIWG